MRNTGYGAVFFILAFILGACAVGGSADVSSTDNITVRANLGDLGPAPELENEVWLNTEGPLRLADLRGKVVLLDMWTFG